MKKAMALCLLSTIILSAHATENFSSHNLRNNARDIFCKYPPAGSSCSAGTTIKRLKIRLGSTVKDPFTPALYTQEIFQVADYTKPFDQAHSEYITCTAYLPRVWETNCQIQCGSAISSPPSCINQTPTFLPSRP